jgi:hypothetical protein
MSWIAEARRGVAHLSSCPVPPNQPEPDSDMQSGIRKLNSVDVCGGDALVIQSSKILCYFCYAELSADASACEKCGRNLRDRLDLLHPPCKVVPDGQRFGIWYKGETKIHGLSLENAESLAALMNSALREEDKN